jgi:hypothetical protein
MTQTSCNAVATANTCILSIIIAAQIQNQQRRSKRLPELEFVYAECKKDGRVSILKRKAGFMITGRNIPVDASATTLKFHTTNTQPSTPPLTVNDYE